MAQYIDLDKLLEEVKRSGHALSEWSTLGVCAIIERQPTIDVVPKSEIERLKDKYEIIYQPKGMIEANAKANVAREIFEEIEKFIVRRMIADCPLIDDRLITDIAELKKKYTEVNNEIS